MNTSEPLCPVWKAPDPKSYPWEVALDGTYYNTLCDVRNAAGELVAQCQSEEVAAVIVAAVNAAHPRRAHSWVLCTSCGREFVEFVLREGECWCCRHTPKKKVSPAGVSPAGGGADDQTC